MIPRLSIFLFLVCSWTTHLAAEPTRVTLTVDSQKVLHQVDPRVYGQFLELIYHSCNGGLWGDIVWNRSFDELPGGGRWGVDGEEITRCPMFDSERLSFGDKKWGDYEFSLQAQKSGGGDGFVIFFRGKSNGDYYRANLGAGDNSSNGLDRGSVIKGRWKREPVGKRTAGKLEDNRWYNLRVRCEGPHFQVWVDDQRVIDFTDGAECYLNGAVGLGGASNQTRFRNLKVTGLDGKTLFEGIPQLPELTGQAKHWKSYGPGKTQTVEGNALNSRYSQRIAGTEGETGVEQGSLCLRAGDPCRGSLWARGKTNGQLVVRLLDGQTVLLEKTLPAPGETWQEYPLELEVKNTVANATLQIGLRGSGEVWIDQVSLMADSSRDAGGFRPDLLKAVDELHAPILRWPGGSFVSQYRWKDGIGPQHKRGTYPVPMWDDQDSNNFGIDEFMALCRRIKTEPLLAVNVGRWDRQGTREQYIQEACDWVEYCNGPSTSTWGKVRAANGHPEPYGVKYWEIDNEPWPMGSKKYGEYVRAFGQAMRKIDPTIKIIANGSLSMLDDNYETERGGLEWNQTLLGDFAKDFDFLDQHQYAKPDQFETAPWVTQEKLDKLAGLIAKSPNPAIRVFMGEWNLQSIDWRSGLHAGGMLNAFERKPVMAIASPALLLRHVSASGWNNAFINFDQSRWFPAPNYVVMKLWRDYCHPKFLAMEGPERPLNSTATLSEDGKSLAVKVVNPSAEAVALTLDVKPGFRVDRAKLLTVAPGSLDARNTLDEPGKVKPELGAVDCSGQTIRCTLPAISASVISIEGSAQ